MGQQTLQYQFLKDVLVAGPETAVAPASPVLVAARLELFRPALTPALLIYLEISFFAAAGPSPRLVVLDGRGQERFTLPLDRPALTALRAAVRRCLVALHLPKPPEEPWQIVFADGGAQVIVLGALRGGELGWTMIDPAGRAESDPDLLAHPLCPFLVGGARGARHVAWLLNQLPQLVCLSAGPIGSLIEAAGPRGGPAKEPRRLWSLPLHNPVFRQDFALGAQLNAYLALYGQVWSAPWIGEWLPDGEAVARLLRCLPRAKYIHYIRHPLQEMVVRLVEAGQSEHPPGAEGSSLPPAARQQVAAVLAGTSSQTFGDIAQEQALFLPLLQAWLLEHGAAWRLHTLAPERIYWLRDDALSARSPWNARAIGRFLGAPDADHAESWTVSPAGSNTLSTVFPQPGPAALDDYARHFSPAQLELAHRFFQGLDEQLGYPIRSPSSSSATVSSSLVHPMVPSSEPPILRLQILHLEPTRRCNIRCVHCNIQEPGYQHDQLPFAQFERLIPIMKAQRPHVILSGHGESLSHPKFDAMFAAVMEAGCTVEFQTNLTLLKPERFEALLRLSQGQRWTRLKTSMDGARQQTFEAIRVGAKFETFMKHLVYIGAHRPEGFPKVTLEVVAMQENMTELAEIARIAARVGCDRLMVTDLVEYPHAQGHSLAGDLERLRPHLEQVAAIAADAHMQVETSGKTRREMGWPAPAAAPDPYCTMPERVAFVRANGQVQPCCFAVVALGDLATDPLEAIWSKERFMAFRQSLRTGVGLHPHCRSCRWWISD